MKHPFVEPKTGDKAAAEKPAAAAPAQPASKPSDLSAPLIGVAGATG